MKSSYSLLMNMFFLFGLTPVLAQETGKESDSVFLAGAIPISEVPQALLAVTDPDLLKHKAALFIFNESLHPLGKAELRDDHARYPYLNIPIRMNRCTLIYIDSGVHQFHTIYQKKGEDLLYQPGNFFLVELTTHTLWPLPIVLHPKNNEEFGAVLFHYISGSRAAALFDKLKKKEVIINQ